MPNFVQAGLCCMLDVCVTVCTCACLCHVCAHAHVVASTHACKFSESIGYRDPALASLCVLSVHASAARVDLIKALSWWSATPCVKPVRGAQCGGQGPAASVPAARRPLVTRAPRNPCHASAALESEACFLYCVSCTRLPQDAQFWPVCHGYRLVCPTAGVECA